MIQGRRKITSISSAETRASKEKALSVLEKIGCGQLYLRLPESWQDALQALMEGFEFNQVVQEMESLGQIRLPEDRHLIASWEPLLKGVIGASDRRDIRCFRDSLHFERERDIALDMVTLSLRARIGRIPTREWRELLEEEIDLYERESREEGEKLEDRVAGHSVAVEMTGFTEDFLRKRGIDVECVVIDSSCLPLDALRRRIAMFRREGRDLPDQEINEGIRDHLAFLDLVMVKGFDRAFEMWRQKQTRNGS